MIRRDAVQRISGRATTVSSPPLTPRGRSQRNKRQQQAAGGRAWVEGDGQGNFRKACDRSPGGRQTRVRTRVPCTKTDSPPCEAHDLPQTRGNPRKTQDDPHACPAHLPVLFSRKGTHLCFRTPGPNGGTPRCQARVPCIKTEQFPHVKRVRHKQNRSDFRVPSTFRYMRGESFHTHGRGLCQTRRANAGHSAHLPIYRHAHTAGAHSTSVQHSGRIFFGIRKKQVIGEFR